MSSDEEDNNNIPAATDDVQDYGYGDDGDDDPDYGYGDDAGDNMTGHSDDYDYDDDDDDDGYSRQTDGFDETSFQDDDEASASSDADDDGDNQMSRLAHRETRAVSCLRNGLLVVLAVATVCVSTSVYVLSRRKQHQAFLAEFHHTSSQVLQSYPTALQTRLQALQSLAVDYASYAQYSNSSWPLVTLPDMEQRAESTRNVAHASSLFVLPIVAASGEQKDATAASAARKEWEAYAQEHRAEWLSSSSSPSLMASIEDISRTLVATTSRRALSNAAVAPSIPEHIFDFSGDYDDDSKVGPPFAPLWETAPFTDGLASWVNFNLLAWPRVSNGLHQAMTSRQAVLERVLNYNDDSKTNEPPAMYALMNAILGHGKDDKDDYSKEPASPLFYPIVQDSKVVAVVTAMIYWRHFLENLVHPEAQAVHVVISSACGNNQGDDSTPQAFTYEVTGRQATYLGWGDLHDTKLERLAQHSDSSSTATSLPFNNDYCSFSWTIYPTTSMREHYLTHEPAVYTLLVVLIFVFACTVFFVYDCLVERRNKVVMNHAIQATTIVSSLFPEAVRDRLFHGEEPPRDTAVADAAAGDGLDQQVEAAESGHISSGLNGSGTSDLESPLLPNASAAAAAAGGLGAGSGGGNTTISQPLVEPAKMRLKNFLHSDDPVSHMESAAKGAAPATAASSSILNKPIADLFPHCTVLFADISGFTAWSSLRDPAQVFTLLESIYSSFDAVARKRGVFKVETVGDSYVAVTGLPDPQEDHAIIMARFARDCRVKMNEVTRKLELTLGPDTGDLCMRFGLHSGPVTAGVLRGERSRFQLFGDTVNTAARMESTGQRDKIQCSQSTADLLRDAGKGYWVKARDELVNAKGKGQLQTYWIDVTTPQRRRYSESSGDGLSRSLHSSDASSVDADYASPESSAIWGGVPDEIPEHVKQHQKHQRLVDYNVDLLLQHLKCVVARRKVLAMSGVDDGPPPEPYIMSTELEDGKTVLDEVQEVIRLPKFDPSAFKGHVDPESIELDKKVVSQLKRYVTVIGAMYRQNPFHNFEHASHVVMSVNKLLQRVVAPDITINANGDSETMASQKIATELHQYTYGITSDPLAQFAILFAALIHDVDHWGVSNGQIITESAPIAAKYKNKSIAEQNSVDLAWDLLMDAEEYSDLQRCIFKTDAEYKRFRSVVVNLVMATDIFDKELGELRKNRWAKAFQEDREPDEDDENRKATIVMEHIMQASDVAHTMQHWHVYQKWNRRLFDELYTAHKAGRMGPDPSTFWCKGEMKFFEGYIIPLAKKLQSCGVFGVASEECLNYAMDNLKEWETKGEMIVSELVANYNKRDEEDKQSSEEDGGGGRRRGKRKTMSRRRSLITTGG